VLGEDVISTGATLAGMKKVVEAAGGVVISQASILTEGDDPAAWSHVVALGHLPLFRV